MMMMMRRRRMTTTTTTTTMMTVSMLRFCCCSFVLFCFVEYCTGSIFWLMVVSFIITKQFPSPNEEQSHGNVKPMNSTLSCLPHILAGVTAPSHFHHGTNAPRLSGHRLVGLVVKASTSRAEDPGFESRLRRDFSGAESYQ